MSDLLENNAYSETTLIQIIKNHKWLITVIVIICTIYFLLTSIGLLAYPKWYLIGSFYLHKSSFEYVKDSGKNFYNSIYDKYDFSECSDPKLAKRIKTVIRCHFSEARWTDQNYDVLVFYTDNYFVERTSRGILYSDHEIEWLYGYYSDCKCKPLGGGWYYYHAAKKGEYFIKG